MAPTTILTVIQPTVARTEMTFITLAMIGALGRHPAIGAAITMTTTLQPRLLIWLLRTGNAVILLVIRGLHAPRRSTRLVRLEMVMRNPSVHRSGRGQRRRRKATLPCQQPKKLESERNAARGLSRFTSGLGVLRRGLPQQALFTTSE